MADYIDSLTFTVTSSTIEDHEGWSFTAGLSHLMVSPPAPRTIVRKVGGYTPVVIPVSANNKGRKWGAILFLKEGSYAANMRELENWFQMRSDVGTIEFTQNAIDENFVVDVPLTETDFDLSGVKLCLTDIVPDPKEDKGPFIKEFLAIFYEADNPAC